MKKHPQSVVNFHKKNQKNETKRNEVPLAKSAGPETVVSVPRLVVPVGVSTMAQQRRRMALSCEQVCEPRVDCMLSDTHPASIDKRHAYVAAPATAPGLPLSPRLIPAPVVFPSSLLSPSELRGLSQGERLSESPHDCCTSLWSQDGAPGTAQHYR